MVMTAMTTTQKVRPNDIPTVNAMSKETKKKLTQFLLQVISAIVAALTAGLGVSSCM